jgi:hypothetical protein
MGTLRPLDTSKGVEETAKFLCDSNGWLPLDFGNGEVDTYEETLLDNGYSEYVIINGVIYEVEDYELEGDIYEAIRMDDGTYQYVVSYYNGGCSFGMAVEQALNNVK